MNANFLEILKGLPLQKRLVFGLMAAERYIDCYKMFNRKEGFGNVICMIEALSIIESAATGEIIDPDLLEKNIRLVNENIPDMDDYGSVGGSLALNFSIVVYLTLSMIKFFEERQLDEISIVCTDSIYFIIHEIENYDQMDLEKIAAHSLMKEETRLQEGIVMYLDKIPNVDIGDLETLRLMQKDREYDKLNIEAILYS